MKQILIFLLSAALYPCGTFAQDAAYRSRQASGYRGGYIKGLKVRNNALDFIVVGDWGRQGEYFQSDVADQMAKAAVSLDLDFVISTGDNFYPDGVASITDPLWESSFEKVYHHFALQKKWYAVLGNHDYRSNPQAQVDYSKVSRRWVMPDRYFSKKMAIDDDTAESVLFVFIDTSPFVAKYYADEVYGPSVATQDSAAQMRWLISILSDTSSSTKWKIVVGHHPLFSGGKRIASKDLKDVNDILGSIFVRYGVDFYLAGHEHHLEYIQPQGKTHYFTSGAGSEIRPTTIYPKVGKFAAAEAGFMTFSITPQNVLVQAVNHKGSIIYTTSIPKVSKKALQLASH